MNSNLDKNEDLQSTINDIIEDVILLEAILLRMEQHSAPACCRCRYKADNASGRRNAPDCGRCYTSPCRTDTRAGTQIPTGAGAFVQEEYGAIALSRAAA